MKFIIAVLFLPAIFAMNYNKIFRRYKLRHHKNYTTPEEAAEARTFVCSCAHDNMLLNREFSHNNDSFSVGLNDFSDQNLTEIRNILCPPIQPPSTQITLPILNITISFPDEQDYSSFLQPIVNQGACGSCWAFAPVAQLESLYLLNFIPFSYKFSPQYLVDCSRTPPNSGCNGGWPSVAMDYIVSNGIPFGSSYCYSGVQNSCAVPNLLSFFVFPRFGSKTVQYKLNGNETQLKTILASKGPVVVVMYASNTFMRYKSGIFYDNECPPGCSSYNHAVLLIGYGVDEATGLPYWNLR